jgi:hypothetical protein
MIANWDNYQMIDGRNFDDLIKKLKRGYEGKDVREVFWGVSSLGKPYVVIEAVVSKAQRRIETPKPAEKPISSGLTEE